MSTVTFVTVAFVLIAFWVFNMALTLWAVRLWRQTRENDVEISYLEGEITRLEEAVRKS